MKWELERMFNTMDKEKIERINYLAKKCKQEGLTEEEKSEQDCLRKEYIRCFRNNFKKQLDCIEIVD